MRPRLVEAVTIGASWTPEEVAAFEREWAAAAPPLRLLVGSADVPMHHRVEVAADSLTEVEERCLVAVDRAGSAVMQARAGDIRFLAAGEWLTFLPGVFLRLLGLGLLCFTGPNRVALTDAGRESLERDVPLWNRGEDASSVEAEGEDA